MIERTIEITPKVIVAFWSRVDQGAADECWEWAGETHTHGYGLYRQWLNGSERKFLAHRLSLLIAGTDIAGRVVRHDCDNPPCVNPSHLRVGTQLENMRDAIERDRMDMSGLAIGLAPVWPPRPCRRCGITVSTGRQRYCPECRVIVTRENHERYRSRKRWLAGATPSQRRDMQRKRRAS